MWLKHPGSINSIVMVLVEEEVTWWTYGPPALISHIGKHYYLRIHFFKKSHVFFLSLRPVKEPL